jgi:DmsE family decaheme c-type cytochrome
VNCPRIGAATAWILLVGIALAIACHAPPEVAESEPSESAPAATYDGDAVCLSCHEAMKPGLTAKYDRTVHARVLNEVNARNELEDHGCEACHGPGSAHAEAGGGKGVGGLVPFGEDTPEAVSLSNGACLTCHKGGERSYWRGSAHESSEIACTSCHTVMENVSHDQLLSAHTEVETCASCHHVQYASVFKNAHMPLRPGAFEASTASEGKMRCSSCHQPHGSVTESLVRNVSVNDQCLSCHAEKRGPFLWEHSPVPENCLNCHDPHGSTRRAMLTMNVPRLCQTCHVSTGHATSAREPTDRFAVGSSCLQCHTQVHGSNHPSGFALTR